ncbi:MAG: dockerin type I repeat-containing protein, partial [Clostridia bacterium]|nr:dockerin type I repeat-containing protein [Clostridia bacterium]
IIIERKIYMKNTLKTALVLLLSLALLLPAASVAFAENGPLSEKVWDEFYIAYVVLTEMNDAETDPVMHKVYYEDVGQEYDEPVELALFRNNEATPQDGAVYDRETNTLTLTDFNKKKYALETNVMGDDFTIEVIGDCYLSHIAAWGDAWGGSITVTGSGSLTVNSKKTFEAGISFYPEGADVKLVLENAGGTSIYGEKTAFEVSGGNDGFAATAGGAEVEVIKENAVRDEILSVETYGHPSEETVVFGTSDSDPDGIYTVSDVSYFIGETEEDFEDPACWEDRVDVGRYIYSAEYDLYLEDRAWADEAGGEFGKISFDSYEDAEAAGFHQNRDASGRPVYAEIIVCGNHSTDNPVSEDAAGNRYVVDGDYTDDLPYDSYAHTMQPIAEVEGAYLLTIAPEIDITTLTEISETVVYEDVFDYRYPSAELLYDGSIVEPVGDDIMPGDVDGDKDVTAQDARLALRGAIGLQELSSIQFIAADVDADKEVTAQDARHILRMSIGLEAKG